MLTIHLFLPLGSISQGRLFVCFWDRGLTFAALTDPELTIWTKLVLNSQRSICLPSGSPQNRLSKQLLLHTWGFLEYKIQGQDCGQQSKRSLVGIAYFSVVSLTHTQRCLPFHPRLCILGTLTKPNMKYVNNSILCCRVVRELWCTRKQGIFWGKPAVENQSMINERFSSDSLA